MGKEGRARRGHNVLFGRSAKPARGRGGMAEQKKRFLVIENRSLDVICERRKMEGLRICENGRGFQVSISFEDEDVA